MRLDHLYTKNEKAHQKQTIYTEKKKKNSKKNPFKNIYFKGYELVGR